MKLLVVMPTKYVGNIVISLRTLSSIVEQNGASETTLVIDETFEQLTRTVLGEAVQLISYPRQQEQRLRRAVRFLGELRSGKYDEILDIDGTVLSGRVARLARGGRKTGPGFAKRIGVYDRVIPIERESQHCFEDFVQMARVVGITVGDGRYLQIPQLNDSELPITLEPNRRTLCIHPSATKDYKQWSIEKFVELADRLASDDWQVVIIGAGKAERARADKLMASMKHGAINAHDRLSLMDLVKLFQRSHLYIGNDSGPMHLAAATGVPVIGLFGPTELIRWRPRAPQTTIMKGRTPCAPDCQPEDCKRNYECLGSLTVDEVASRAADIAGAHEK